MINTCGIFLYLIPENKFLVGHVTGNGLYSIPKGKQESNESYFEAAKREMLEETNINYDDLNVLNIIRLEPQTYNSRKKRLYSYLIIANNKSTDFDIVCNAMVTDRNYPEFDGFIWTSFENIKVNLHHSQKRAITQILDNEFFDRFVEPDAEYFDFTKEKLEFSTILTNKKYKGLSKKYIIQCALDEKIQKNWEPQIGDLILGVTGNVFAISGIHHLADRLGGDRFYFGGHACARNESGIMNSTACYTMNKDGIAYDYVSDSKYPEPIPTFEKRISSIKDYRWIPYPHELKDMWS